MASGAQNSPEIEDGDTGMTGMEDVAGTAAQNAAPINDAHSRTRGHSQPPAPPTSARTNNSRAPTARSEASAASGTSRRAPPSEADVEQDLQEEQPEPHREDGDVSEQLYARLARQFGGRINALFDEFESITNVLNEDRAVQKEERKMQAAAERRREEKFRAALQAQQEAMATLAVEFHDRVDGIGKGKFITRLPDGSETVDHDGLQLPRISVTAPRPSSDARGRPAPAQPAATDSRTRTNRQVTIEEATAREAPPHLDPRQAIDSDSRLRRANLLPAATAARMAAPDATAPRNQSESASQAYATRRAADDAPDGDSEDEQAYPAMTPPPQGRLRPRTGLAPGGQAHASLSPPATLAPQTILSAYGGHQVSSGTPPPARGTGLPMDPYLEMNLQKIRDQIDRMVGRQRAGAPPKSAAKPTTPSAYDGKNDHEVFYTWLCSITTYLRLSYLCGEEYDEDRLLHTVNCLTGEAQEWWQEEVLNAVFHGRRSWTFRDAMCALYTRFVRKGSSQTAARQFRRTRYSKSKGGANAFYNRIVKYAGRMVIHPDDYTMSSKFYDGIPPAMSSALTKIYQLTPEDCNIGQLLYHALIIEDNDEYLEHRERDFDTTRAAATMAPRAPSSRPAASSARPHQDAVPRKTPARTTTTIATPSAPVSGGSALAASRRPDGGNRGQRRDAKRGQCYNCKSSSHYANDPVCPMYVKPALRRIADDGPDDGVPAESESPAPASQTTTQPEPEAALMSMHADDTTDEESSTDWYADGSQYESEGSGDSDPEDTSRESSEDEYFRSMRVVEDDAPALAALPAPTTRSAQRAVEDALAIARALDDPELPELLTSLHDPSVDDDDARGSDDDDMPSLQTVSDSEDDHVGWGTADDSDDEDADAAPLEGTTATVDGTDPDVAFAALFGQAMFEPIHDMALPQAVSTDEPQVPTHDEQVAALRQQLADRDVLIARRTEHLLSLQRDIHTLRSALVHDIPAATLHRLLANIAQRDLHLTLRDNGSDGLPGFIPSSDADDALVSHLIQRRYNLAPADERLSALDAATAGRVYRTAMRTTGSAQQRPSSASRCFSVYVEIHGLQALALIDTGSTINCVSPEFARVSRLPVFELSNPVGLQLGCVGSRSRINFGVRTAIQLANFSRSTYLDVVNIDHYDIILGIPYMKDVGMVLDFGKDCLRLGDASVPVLRGEGSTYVERRTQAQEATGARSATTAPRN